MKNLAILVGLWAATGLLSVACGDSDEGSDGDDGSKGGSSGASGASSGGTAGTPATGGSAGTPATGGTAGTSATGGTAGTGAEGGVGAAGGMGEDGGVGAEGGMGAAGGDGPGPGMGCPATEPAAATMCTTRGLSCDFGDRICRCNVGSGNWNCFDQNGDCPAAPDPNGDCMGGMTACSYGGDGTCVCVMGNFTCDPGVVTCPANRPQDGAGCTMFPAGFDCSYDAGDCSCMAAGGGGMMRSWNCQDAACPAMTPDNGDACPTPGLICDFTTPGPGADPTCVCNTMSQWTCL